MEIDPSIIKAIKMKINHFFFSIALLMLAMPLKSQSNRSGNDYFLQIGVGRTMLNHFQQIGFNQSKMSNSLIAEIGPEKGLWRIGGFIQTPETYEYSAFQLERKKMGIYGKANLAPFIKSLPYGIDPYLHAGANMQKTIFRNANENSASAELLNDDIRYAFGGGLDIGRRLFILGIHYSFSPDSVLLNDPELGPLNFQTTTHSLELRLSVRLSSKMFGGNGICPKFGKKKKGQTKF